MTRSLIALGGNLGDVAATFWSALERLDTDPAIAVVRVASNHGTRPVGTNAGDAFLNSAAELETTLGPAELLARLHEVEAAEGRIRTLHWGPRTLDLDLLLHGDVVVDTPELHVPHPALWYRRFVLDPLVEIAPDIVHPVQGATVRELHTRLLERPLRLSLSGGTPMQEKAIVEAVEIRFPGLVTLEHDPAATIVGHLGEYDASPPSNRRQPSVVDLSACEDPATALVDVVTAALG